MTTADHIANMFDNETNFHNKHGHYLPSFCMDQGPVEVIRSGAETQYIFEDESSIIIVGDIWYVES